MIDVLWKSRSTSPGAFTSIAVTRSELVVTRQKGAITMHLRGPETRPSAATVPADAEFFGIQLKLGAYMTPLPPVDFVDQGLLLPGASNRAFWLQGSAWEYPTFENADVFIARLIREGLLTHEPIVTRVMDGEPVDVTSRTAERRFARATGLTQGIIHQIERARKAAAALEQGTSILDTVELAGYSDQSHLTRAMTRFIGQTPAQILHATR